MVGNILVGGSCFLIADAVNAEMAGFKEHRSQIFVITGIYQPFYLAVAVYIDYKQAAVLFRRRWSVGQAYSNGVAVKVGDGYVLSVCQIRK